MLSDHIEKLMMFLKHEATQKAKAHEQQRRLQKELELVKASASYSTYIFCLDGSMVFSAVKSEGVAVRASRAFETTYCQLRHGE